MICLSCRHTVSVGDVRPQGPDRLSNGGRSREEALLALGQLAMDVGNEAEASEYFSRVLELDPSNFRALFGKGVSAAKLSDPGNFRAKELVKYTELAIRSAPYHLQPAVQREAAKEILDVCVGYRFVIARDGGRYDNLKVLSCLDYALDLSPNDPDIIEAIIFQLSYLAARGLRNTSVQLPGFLEKLRRIDRNRAEDIEILLEALEPDTDIRDLKAESETEKKRREERSRYLEERAREFEKFKKRESRVKIARRVTGGVLILAVAVSGMMYCSGGSNDPGLRQTSDGSWERVRDRGN